MVQFEKFKGFERFCKVLYIQTLFLLKVCMIEHLQYNYKKCQIYIWF